MMLEFFPRRTVWALLITGLLVLTGASYAPAEAACLSQQETRALVASGQVIRVGALKGKIRGEVVNVRLCERKGRLFYRVTVLAANGNVRRLRFDARTGRRMGGK